MVTGFTFQPIHNFVPKVQSVEFNEDGSLKAFGDQRYIALENEGRTNNYQNPTSFNPQSTDPNVSSIDVKNPFQTSTSGSEAGGEELSSQANQTQGING